MPETDPESGLYVETFFDFMFGDGAIPVRRFEETDREMSFLDSGGVYGTDGDCQQCGQNTPFVVSLGEAETTFWRGTCCYCWTQLRVPATRDDEGGWDLAVGRAELVALDPVSAYEETSMGTVEAEEVDEADVSE